METSSLDIIMQAAFWGTVAVTITGASIAIFPRNILYNVLGLALALTGISGFYLFLGSFFIALMQLLIYVGAICIAIVFAIMLSRPLHLETPPWAIPKVAMAIAASAVFFVAPRARPRLRSRAIANPQALRLQALARRRPARVALSALILRTWRGIPKPTAPQPWWQPPLTSSTTN